VARKKTSDHRLKLKADISNRLREVRQSLFGEHGGPELARRLNLPARTWYNYETGVTVPAEVLLAFIDQTGVNPLWLLTGSGPMYRRGVEDQVLSELTPQDLIRRGLEKLEQSGLEPAGGDITGHRTKNAEFASIGLVELQELKAGPIEPRDIVTYIPIRRDWLTHPSQTIAVRLDDMAMQPILPLGSFLAIDRSMRQPDQLEGRIVAARVEGRVVIRWLERSGRHVILRPNQTGNDIPTLALELEEPSEEAFEPILGRVVWSWSRFD